MKFLHKNLPKWIRWVVLSSSSWNLHCQHQTMDEDNRPCGLRAALLGGGVSDPARLSESADGPTTGGCLWPHRCVNGWRKRRGLYDIYMEWWGWYFWIFEKPLRLRLMGPAHPIFFVAQRIDPVIPWVPSTVAMENLALFNGKIIELDGPWRRYASLLI
jgi:hypothetical protein